VIIEFKKWITKCDGCGIEVEGTGPIPMPPSDWHDNTLPSFTDGYIVSTSLDDFYQEISHANKHWCPDCWDIKDTLE